ncbi:vegetative cell wall protein gp1 [Brachypodium distachyon]|uniref:Uncharacterized protein n=1 Tax=Brachypodium distachyon TaxID=15368 RepID=A0A2K2CZ86_BRADI|nr:vegetative cell wall protein gp1 [Brachypodium distachyon]PNT67344.1 hypothetical protein BRADI_3g25661v3 [Brachypodium distachyon]|eukprot:XP_010234714.1 vegetative cell wall protein gp1 [Brachypodium distachyon]
MAGSPTSLSPRAPSSLASRAASPASPSTAPDARVARVRLAAACCPWPAPPLPVAACFPSLHAVARASSSPPRMPSLPAPPSAFPSAARPRLPFPVPPDATAHVALAPAPPFPIAWPPARLPCSPAPPPLAPGRAACNRSASPSLASTAPPLPRRLVPLCPWPPLLPAPISSGLLCCRRPSPQAQLLVLGPSPSPVQAKPVAFFLFYFSGIVPLRCGPCLPAACCCRCCVATAPRRDTSLLHMLLPHIVGTVETNIASNPGAGAMNDYDCDD